MVETSGVGDGWQGSFPQAPASGAPGAKNFGPDPPAPRRRSPLKSILAVRRPHVVHSALAPQCIGTGTGIGTGSGKAGCV